MSVASITTAAKNGMLEAMRPASAWKTGEVYVAGAVVAYENVFYVCILGLTSTTAPSADTTHWSTLEFKYYGLMERGTAKAVTSESSSKIKLTGSLANGTVVVFTNVVGGKVPGSGQSIIAGREYSVVESEANAFKISETPGGAPVVWSEEEIKTGTELAVWKEGEYGTGGRVETKPAAAVNGAIEDSTARGLKPKKGVIVDGIGCFSMTTGGILMALGEVTEETIGTEGTTYSVTSGQYNLQAGQ